MVDILADRVKKAYTDKVSEFFEDVKRMNLSDKELTAIPSLFVPGWDEGYDASCLKIAIAGKETLCWSNEHGDSLKCDLDAYENGQYDVLASCRRFREEGPAEWRNVFWQYPATAIAKLYGCTRDEVLSKDSPLLRSIAWFNGHAIETYDSQGVTKTDISPEKMTDLRLAADRAGLSDFETFVKVFRPNVIFYFYRNKSGVPERNFPADIEFVQGWGNGMIDEYRLNGQTIMLHCPHTTYLAHGNLKQDELAGLVQNILKVRNVKVAPCEQNVTIDLYRMTAVEWMTWVDFVRNEALKYPESDNTTLSRHLIAVVASELAKRKSTMNAQTLVLILNEVDKFRRDNWQYSPERRGPCSSVRGAWSSYDSNGKKDEAKWIAEAFTKLNGTYAWE